jgi:pimeloyl-ACP methyl ester carboxylesterase
MPPRRRRADEPRPRRWPLLLLFVLGALAGAALWAYAPDLPPDQLIARYTNDHSKFVDVGGTRAHVRDEGKPDGQPLLLIHGSLGSLHVWEGWVKELGDRYRLISVDLPGHGLTGAWPRGEYTIEAYCDFIEVLADTLRLDRFAIAGHSLGGAVAWNFAATRPEHVTHLILVDSAGFPKGGAPPLALRIARTPVLGELGIHFKPDTWLRRSLEEIYADPAMVTPERVKRYGELQRFPGNRAATLARARTQEPLDPSVLKHLNLPALIEWGAKDRWVPVADAYRFQTDIKGAKLAIFEKLGHAPMEEDPKATADAVAAFLPAQPPPPPAPPVQPAASEPPSGDQRGDQKGDQQMRDQPSPDQLAPGQANPDQPIPKPAPPVVEPEKPAQPEPDKPQPDKTESDKQTDVPTSAPLPNQDPSKVNEKAKEKE